MQEEFFKKYCQEFEEADENKLIYTTIFKEYTKKTESYIEEVRVFIIKNLKIRLPQYKLEDFYKLLKTRKNEVDEQLLEMLLSFSDFQIFKEMMLDYKYKSQGKSQAIFGLSITKADCENSFDDL